MRLPRGAVRVALRACRVPLASHRISLGGKRKMYDAFTGVARPLKGVQWERAVVGGVPVERMVGGFETGETLIYLHGGAYGLGSARGYRGVAGRLAAAAGTTAVVPDYSLSPEARYPVALQETVAVYTALLTDGLDPTRTVIAGDSAGGGLTLALAMTLRDSGIALPAALGLICPWADLALDCQGRRPAGRDPLITPAMASVWAPRYAGSHDPRLPGISPVYGDFAGLPPIVLQSAGDYPLIVDAEKIEKAATDVEHRRFDGLWHDFHLQTGVLAAADHAIAELGALLRAHVQGHQSADHSSG